MNDYSSNPDETSKESLQRSIDDLRTREPFDPVVTESGKIVLVRTHGGNIITLPYNVAGSLGETLRMVSTWRKAMRLGQRSMKWSTTTRPTSQTDDRDTVYVRGDIHRYRGAHADGETDLPDDDTGDSLVGVCDRMCYSRHPTNSDTTSGSTLHEKIKNLRQPIYERTNAEYFTKILGANIHGDEEIPSQFRSKTSRVSALTFTRICT
jgi:hypothetical protein